MVELRVFGSTDLRGADGEEIQAVLAQPKRLALLTYIVIAKPRGFHRRDKLLGLFWPELDQERARGALRKALYFLRQSLGETVLVGRGDDEVGIGEHVLSCDVLAFEAAVDAGEWEKALELYRGDALVGLYVTDALGFEQWLEGERTRLRRRAADAAREFTLEEEAAGHTDSAVKIARRLTQLLPHDELAICELMGVLDRTGDRAGAIRAIDDGWRFYHTQMGLKDPMLENLRKSHRFLTLMETVRVRLADERAWVEELEALPESQRLERMLGDVAEWIARARASQTDVEASA